MAGPEILDDVYRVIIDRIERRPEGSYVASLVSEEGDKDPLNRICEKVVEEAAELILAAKDGDRDAIVWEAADLIFHVLVLLGYMGVEPGEVWNELERRRR